jgi:glycosyltransferase involved in cell wall biosynthesis
MERRVKNAGDHVRVLYSFPHKLGASRICYTALQQINGLAQAGADVLAAPASLSGAVAEGVTVSPTLARGSLRVPYKLVGSMRAFALHDYIVSRRVEKLAGQIDIIHTWPLGALRTLRVAARLGIPTVLERPNAHTRFAYEAVRKECERIGVPLPADHEHAFKLDVLQKEEEEYRLAYRLLCPSDFVARTFLERGFSTEKLARHHYGFDDKKYHSNSEARKSGSGLNVIFVGVAAVRKGLHYALEAWLNSPAHLQGTFLVVGEILPAYQSKLSSMLSHPSVRVLGHRNDVADLMSRSDVLILPSIEEGSALVTSEARASGCVLLVSDAAGAICTHMENALVHRVGDVSTLAHQITMIHEDRVMLERLRTSSLRTVPEITWKAAGIRLLDVYQETIEMYSHGTTTRLVDEHLRIPA